MIRILIFFAIIFAIAMGGAWVADQPGLITIDWLGYIIELSPIHGIIAFIIVLSLSILFWTGIRIVIGAPQALGGFFLRRRSERGYRALANGMIAIGAGDLRKASRFAKEAEKLLSDEPATRLLTAQAAQMQGDNVAANSAFKALVEDSHTRMLGLHGLFIEARRQQDHEALRRIVEEAVKFDPRVDWAIQAHFDVRCQDGNWDGALGSLDLMVKHKITDKENAKRKRAVILCAKALDLESAEPVAARDAAIKAHGLAPKLPPAATIAARLLVRKGDLRKAAKILETSWKLFPHPEIAEAYAVLRSGDSAKDRLKRMKNLAVLTPRHMEAVVAVAGAAIEALQWQEARKLLRPLFDQNPTERLFLLMADLEEGETGNIGRVREWLARAVKARRDEAWVADGSIWDEWMPLTPISKTLDGFVWRQPDADQEWLGSVGDDQDSDLMQLLSHSDIVDESSPDLNIMDVEVAGDEQQSADESRLDSDNPEDVVDIVVDDGPSEVSQASGDAIEENSVDSRGTVPPPPDDPGPKKERSNSLRPDDPA